VLGPGHDSVSKAVAPYARIHCGVDVILRRSCLCAGLSVSLTAHHPAQGDDILSLEETEIATAVEVS
jgi:hypothetical protein